MDNETTAQQYEEDALVQARRTAEANYDRRFKSGLVPIRNETILVGGAPVELINGQAIASRAGWNRTRLSDWEEHRMIPPSIRIRGIRFYTKRQTELMAALAELSPNRRLTTGQRETRDKFVREVVWRRWWH